MNLSFPLFSDPYIQVPSHCTDYLFSMNLTVLNSNVFIIQKMKKKNFNVNKPMYARFGPTNVGIWAFFTK